MSAEFEALRREYEELRVGPLMMALVYRLAAQVAAPYPPDIYGASEGHWNRDAVNDLVQDVMLHQLLAQGQLRYLWTVADTTGALERLIQMKVRRALSERRKRSVLDNLVRRCRVLVRDDPALDVVERGRDFSFALRGRNPSNETPTERQIRELALGVSGIKPRRAGRGTERAPAVYSNEQLRALIRQVAKDAPMWLTTRDLDAILRLLLTPWLVTTLEDSSDLDPKAAELSPEELVIVREAVHELMGKLNAEERAVFRLKAANMQDRDIAPIIGRVRQTVFNHKKSIDAKLIDSLGDLLDVLRDAGAEAVLIALLAEVSDAAG